MRLVITDQLLYVAVFFVSYCELPSSAASLYDDDKYVLQLSPSNFSSVVYGKNNAFVVEFYSDTCPACIFFAPTYKNLANQLKSWSPLIKFAAVNCRDYTELCSSQVITAYPTLKYFKYLSPNRLVGEQIMRSNPEKLPLHLASLLHKDWIRNKPEHWPNLVPLKDDYSLDVIWNSGLGSVRFVGLVVEQDPSELAWATMIHFANDKRVRLFLVSPSHVDVVEKKKRNDSSVGFYLFERNRSDPSAALSFNVAFKHVVELMKKKLQSVEPEKIDYKAETTTVSSPAVNVTWSQYEVHVIDILSALYSMLLKEIPNDIVFSNQKLEALKMWMAVLSKHMPTIYPSAGIFCESLYKWITNHNGNITREVWLEKVQLYMSENGHPIRFPTQWAACRGSKPLLRDYSCGLWTLLHLLTVQARSDGNSTFNAVDEVLQPIHLFILNFFNCEHCKKHFNTHYLKTVGQNETPVVILDNAILWLWNTHNIVNKVLKMQHREDPAFPKRQFPPFFLCESCWRINKFEENEVLKFLISYYGKENVNYNLKVKVSSCM
uniref:Sulfhydryl oxidase n=1 Tax=Syphacia muris TaxID=451379 RepID=A0A0N5ARD0_9BILA